MQLPPITAPGALAAPFVRAWRLSGDEAASGMLFGVLGFLVDPVFWVGVLLLALFSAWDWLLGTRLAVWRREYDGDRAYNGILSKMSGVFVVVGLRVFVEYLRASGVPMPAEMTVGIAGAVLNSVLIVSEVKSIGEKQVQLGGSSLAPVIRMLDRILRIERKEGES